MRKCKRSTNLSSNKQKTGQPLNKASSISKSWAGLLPPVFFWIIQSVFESFIQYNLNEFWSMLI